MEKIINYKLNLKKYFSGIRNDLWVLTLLKQCPLSRFPVIPVACELEDAISYIKQS